MRKSRTAQVNRLNELLTATLRGVAADRARIERVECRPQLRYIGVWREPEEYVPGNMVSHRGSMWACQAPTRSKPGTSRDWQLCVKAGRDGRDARATNG
jgi:hypothetical protein